MENYEPPRHGLMHAAMTEGLLDQDGRPKPISMQGLGGDLTYNSAYSLRRSNRCYMYVM